MTTDSIPPTLFKYAAPARASQLLGALRIRFSQVSVLNDADEFQPPYKGVATRADIEKQVVERFRLKHPKEFAQVYEVLPKEKAEKFIQEMVPEWADRVEANYEKSVQGVYERLDSNFGILSLSETATSRLMWSFYSDGGRGLVIEFDSNDPWFNAKKASDDSFRHLHKVKYVEDREPDYLLTTKDEDLLYTKATEWEFEKEWRIIRNFNDACDIVGKDSIGKDVLLFAIPPEAIKSVIFGYRATPDLEAALRNIIASNPQLKHVNVKRAFREANGHIEIVPA